MGSRATCSACIVRGVTHLCHRRRRGAAVEPVLDDTEPVHEKCNTAARKEEYAGEGSSCTVSQTSAVDMQCGSKVEQW